MSSNLEVFFCDLCNESVPQTDLQSGKAVQIKGRVVGACCAGTLRRAAGASEERRTGGAASAVAGIVVLAGVAAGAAFLDWRLSEEVNSVATRLQGIAERVQQGHERLLTLEEAVTRVGARVDPEGLRTRLDAVDGRLDAARSSAEARDARIQEALQAATERERLASAEQRDALAGLRAALQSVTAEVAGLRALPSPPPKATEPSEPPPSEPPAAAAAKPAPGEAALPPELEHQVLALADEDPGTRFSAVDKLLRSQDMRVLPALLPMAKDANIFVRRLTLEGLRDFRRPESVDALLVALADPEPIVRLTASASLRALTGQRIEFDDATAATRAAGQRRWQEWWDKNRATFTF